MAPWLVALALAQASAEEPVAFLAELPVESKLEGPVVWGQVALRVTPRADAVAPPAFVARRGATLRGGTYLVDHLDAVASKDAVLPRHRRPSWVIDYDQPAFAPAVEAVRAQLGARPSAAALTGFAAAYLNKKGYSRAFDLASRVAVTREGDCTEHAVFLAALLRSFGIPARAMLGLVVLAPRGRAVAFGHMWVEAWVNGRWVVADAAVPDAVASAHLPVGELAEEGPSYPLALARLLQSMAFERLELVAAAR
jgi:transglutaminase-like putative cysteine protease